MRPSFSSSLSRDASLEQIRSRREPWDIAVVGGGATGVGIALDAAARGYSVALFEAADFGKGTSSRSTKLIHGGVRYLAQGDVPLVREALYERGLLLRNAPHLVHRLGFVIPAHSLAESAWYRMGIGVYDTLARGQRFGASKWLNAAGLMHSLPGLRRDSFTGGVLFYDGQFDDTRLLISLARTAASFGAVLANYTPVTAFLRSGSGSVSGVVVHDTESGSSLEVPAQVVVNATGAFSDSVRKMAEPNGQPNVSASRGSHIVLPRSFLPSDNALLVPKTRDGRVLFAIPWHGYTLAGTTDIGIGDAPLDPVPSSSEIDFILETAAGYLARAPRREDILSVFAGIRPLVRSDGNTTAALSRDHSIFTERTGLITIVGGKWTTYRRMAEDCVNLAAERAGLPARPCQTPSIRLTDWADPASLPHSSLAAYGSDVPALQQMMEDPEAAARLHPDFPWTAAHVTWAVWQEMARTVEDVLARRTRMLFLNASAAIEAAPRVAAQMSQLIGKDQRWSEEQASTFRSLAETYRAL